MSAFRDEGPEFGVRDSRNPQVALMVGWAAFGALARGLKVGLAAFASTAAGALVVTED